MDGKEVDGKEADGKELDCRETDDQEFVVSSAEIRSGATGREYSQPCPVSQPIPRRRVAWEAVSTHSAVTVRPRRWAS